MQWFKNLFDQWFRPVPATGRAPCKPTLEQLEDRTVPTNLVAYFPGYGVYTYNEIPSNGPIGWKQLTGAAAQSVAITERGDGPATVAASLTGYGVYEYTDAAGWRLLTGAVASQVDIAGGSQSPTPAYVVGEFPGAGVWLYGGTTWRQLTGANASQVSVDEAGDVAADFPGYGVYLYTAAQNSWQLLTTADAGQVVVGFNGIGVSPTVGATFSGYGTYLYGTSTGWVQLSSAMASSIAFDNAGGSGGLAASFAGYGTYLYQLSQNSWLQLTPSVAAQVGIDSSENVAAEYPGAGVWYWTQITGQWQQITGADASLLAARGQ